MSRDSSRSQKRRDDAQAPPELKASMATGRVGARRRSAPQMLGGLNVKLSLLAGALAAGAALVFMAPGNAQPFGPAPYGPPPYGAPPYEVLAPGEIIASVRSAGFGPVSRPA